MYTKADIESSNREERERKLSYAALNTMEKVSLEDDAQGMCVTLVKLRLAQKDYCDTLVIAQATAEDGTPMVCFVSGDNVLSAMVKFTKGWCSGELKWRIDEYRIKGP